jgi:hypothetical protein
MSHVEKEQLIESKTNNNYPSGNGLAFIPVACAFGVLTGIFLLFVWLIEPHESIDGS